MLIAGIAVVRDEADVIESFARHNLNLLDHLLIVDNLSGDNTVSILSAMADEGLPIEVLKWDSIYHSQESAMVKGVDYLSTHEPQFDFVVLLDADEFICCSSREEFHEDLTSAPADLIPAMAWKTFVPHSSSASTDPIDNIANSMHWARYPEEPQQFKSIVPRALFGRCKISKGNHRVFSLTGEMLPGHVLSTRLGHFPIRSETQAMGKLLMGAHTMSIMRNKIAGEGSTWTSLAKKVRENGYRISPDQLLSFALGYGQYDAINGTSPSSVVKDPMPRFPNSFLRYPMLAETSLAHRLDRFCEQLARANIALADEIEAAKRAN